MTTPDPTTLPTDLEAQTPSSIHPELHNEVNQRVLDLQVAVELLQQGGGGGQAPVASPSSLDVVYVGNRPISNPLDLSGGFRVTQGDSLFSFDPDGNLVVTSTGFYSILAQGRVFVPVTPDPSQFGQLSVNVVTQAPSVIYGPDSTRLVTRGELQHEVNHAALAFLEAGAVVRMNVAAVDFPGQPSLSEASFGMLRVG